MREIPIEETLQDVAEIKQTIYDYIVLRRREDAEKNKAVDKTREKSSGA